MKKLLGGQNEEDIYDSNRLTLMAGVIVGVIVFAIIVIVFAIRRKKTLGKSETT